MVFASMVTPRQTVEVHPARSTSELMFEHVAFTTANVEALRLYLKSKGVTVPDSVKTLRDGEKEFLVKDPEGNAIEFVQHAPGMSKQPGNAPDSISGRIIHAGFIVKSAAAEDHFYKDILGFKLYWMGGDEGWRHGLLLPPGTGRHGLDRVHAERWNPTQATARSASMTTSR